MTREAGGVATAPPSGGSAPASAPLAGPEPPPQHLRVAPKPLGDWRCFSDPLVKDITGLAVHLASGEIVAADYKNGRLLCFDDGEMKTFRFLPFEPHACDEDEESGAVARPLKVAVDPSPCGLLYVVVWGVRRSGGYHSASLYVLKRKDGAFVARIAMPDRLILRVGVDTLSADVYVVTSPKVDEPPMHHVVVLAAGSLNVKRIFASHVPYTGKTGIGVTTDLETSKLQLTDQRGDVYTYSSDGALIARWTPTDALTGTVCLSDGLCATYDSAGQRFDVRETLSGRCLLKWSPDSDRSVHFEKPQTACYNPLTGELLLSVTYRGESVVAARRLGHVSVEAG